MRVRRRAVEIECLILMVVVVLIKPQATSYKFEHGKRSVNISKSAFGVPRSRDVGPFKEDSIKLQW